MNANITLAQEWIAQADAILIGASNGLSIAEGYHIFANNEMFRRQFGDMQQQYGFRNVVEGLYFQYPTAEARLEFHRRLVKFWVEDYQPSQVMHDLMKVIGHANVSGREVECKRVLRFPGRSLLPGEADVVQKTLLYLLLRINIIKGTELAVIRLSCL